MEYDLPCFDIFIGKTCQSRDRQSVKPASLRAGRPHNGILSDYKCILLYHRPEDLSSAFPPFFEKNLKKGLHFEIKHAIINKYRN